VPHSVATAICFNHFSQPPGHPSPPATSFVSSRSDPPLSIPDRDQGQLHPNLIFRVHNRAPPVRAISTVMSSRESPRTLMLRRSASASNSDHSARSLATASKSRSRQRGAPWWTSAQTRRPSRRPSFAGPAHSHNRMTLAIYNRPTEVMQLAATAALEGAFS
jgi:hypothetical protein